MDRLTYSKFPASRVSNYSSLLAWGRRAAAEGRPPSANLIDDDNYAAGYHSVSLAGGREGWITALPNIPQEELGIYRFIPTREDWNPTFEGHLRLAVLPLSSGLVRICLWGGDDFGMEKDQSITFAEAKEQAEQIPIPVERQWLLEHGFQYA